MIVMFFISAFLTQCTSVRLIQEYDEITDQRVTALQEKVARYFVTIERNIGQPEAAYEKFTSFYDDVKVELDVLRVRNKAIPKAEIAVQQLESLQKQFDSLEKLHKLGFNTIEEVQPAKNAIENSFAAVLQLQMALKNRVKV